MARRFVIPQPKSVLLESFDLPALSPTDVRVRIDHSLMSTGTENTAFNGIFDPASHWGDYVRYPFHPGYSSTGEITGTGSDVTTAQVGDRIFTMWSHASEHVLPEVAAFPLPTGIDPVAANWCALGGIAYVGIKRARIAPGDTVVVIGAGPVGQMTIRWATLSGAHRIIVIDPATQRLDLARAGGATSGIGLPVAEALPAIREITGGGRADIVIDTTGRAATFAEALPLVRDFGRFAIVGDAGDPTRQHLTRDLIERGVEVVAAHGNYMPYIMGQHAPETRDTEPRESERGRRPPGWRAFSALFFDLVAQGRFPLEGLISHTFPAEQAADAFALANTRRAETMGIAFTW